MTTGLLVAILVLVSVLVAGILITKKKKVEFPPIVIGTMPTPPEPTPEETGPSVTPTPAELDTNNEQLS